MVSAINKYLDKSKFILYVIGDKPKLFDSVQIEKKFFGNIKSDKILKKIYSASDIFVLPSIAESFGQVFIEAGSIGLPCICFKNTAATEIIKHKINGYSARFKSTRDLSYGINWCKNNLLNSDAIYETMISFKRAGASAIVSYFALELAKKLNKIN